jgi:hypothetical protein
VPENGVLSACLGYREVVFGESEKTTAERLILVSDVEWLHLETPALIHPGETYWFEPDTNSLIVEGQDGHRRSFAAAWLGGPHAPR